MSTRAYVVLEVEKGKYEYIYSHSDGYPEYLGMVLQEHYSIYEKVRELINQGGASFIDETIETSRFYTSWRGEDLEIGTYDKVLDLEEVLNFTENSWIEYVYVYQKIFANDEKYEWKGYSVCEEKEINLKEVVACHTI